MRKITGNKKGIDTILAALLMVVIVVVASVMVYAWSTGLLGTLLINPNNNKEGPLYADFSGFNNCGGSTCTNATINIRNAGTLAVTLTQYYITDSSGNQWARLSWTPAAGAPTIAPNAVTPTIFLIGNGSAGQCPTGSCTYTGTTNGFNNFVTGSYTVKVETSRNNPFSFTITK